MEVPEYGVALGFLRVRVPAVAQKQVRLTFASLFHSSMSRAVGYLRTSSLTNVGFLKDSEDRQREAISACANFFGHEIAEDAWFSDPGVSGTDPVDSRRGFMQMMEYCAERDIRVVLVEDSSRLARDVITLEVAYNFLQGLEFKLISAAAPSQFLEDSPTAKLVRTVLGAVSEFERSQVLQRLKAARDRSAKRKFKRVRFARTNSNRPKPCGRNNMLQQYPELVPILEKYAAEPEFTWADAQGVVAEASLLNIKQRNGRPFQPQSVQRAMGVLVAQLAADVADACVGVDDLANFADADQPT